MKAVFDEISKAIIGDGLPTFLMLISLLAKGHVLIEDVPGVGKTLLAQAMAKSTSLAFNRVQCTPDVLPSDILGFSIYDLKSGDSKYIQGPVMTNILLIDEINRASPKTQSALLEVMEESKVTVDGNIHPVQTPFMVIATQNPIENIGTSPLPEAQLDRFMMRISMGYPSEDNEIEILNRYQNSNPLEIIQSVLSREKIQSMQDEASNIHVSNSIKRYIVDIVNKTRGHKKISLGASPRASIALMRCAQSKAYINGKNYVSPDDVKMLCEYVLAHRIILSTQLYGLSSIKIAKEIIKEIVDSTTVHTV